MFRKSVSSKSSMQGCGDSNNVFFQCRDDEMLCRRRKNIGPMSDKSRHSVVHFLTSDIQLRTINSVNLLYFLLTCTKNPSKMAFGCWRKRRPLVWSTGPGPSKIALNASELRIGLLDWSRGEAHHSAVAAHCSLGDVFCSFWESKVGCQPEWWQIATAG